LRGCKISILPKSNQTCPNLYQFCPNLLNFAQNFPICPKISQILPKFCLNLPTFCPQKCHTDCACIPSSYGTISDQVRKQVETKLKKSATSVSWEEDLAIKAVQRGISGQIPVPYTACCVFTLFILFIP